MRIVKDRKTVQDIDVPYKFWGREEFKRLMDFDMALEGSIPIQLDGIAPVFVYAYLTSHISGEIYITDPKLPGGKVLFRDTKEAPIEKIDILDYRTEIGLNETILHIDIPGNIFNMDLFQNIPSPPLISSDK